jgi:hypothetical protein
MGGNTAGEIDGEAGKWRLMSRNTAFTWKTRQATAADGRNTVVDGQKCGGRWANE